MSFAHALARRRTFLLPLDVGAGLLAVAAGVWFLGSTWGGPLALGGALAGAGCGVVGGKWVWDAVRAA